MPYLTVTGTQQAPYLTQLEHPVVVQRLLQLSSPSAAHTPMQLDVDLGLRVAFRHAARGHFHLVLHHCTHRTWQCQQQQYGLCVIFHTPQMATSSVAVRTVCHISHTTQYQCHQCQYRLSAVFRYAAMHVHTRTHTHTHTQILSLTHAHTHTHRFSLSLTHTHIFLSLIHI